MAKAKPIKITPVSEQEAKDLYGDVEPQPMAAVGFEGGGGGGPVEWDDVQNKPNLADGDVYSSFEFGAGGESQSGGAIAKSFDPENAGNAENLDQFAILADRTGVSGNVDIAGELKVSNDLRLGNSTSLPDAVLSTKTFADTETALVSSVVVEAPAFEGSLRGDGNNIRVNPTMGTEDSLRNYIRDLINRIEALETSNSDLVSRIEALENQP